MEEDISCSGIFEMFYISISYSYMFETQNLFLHQEENIMNALENRKTAVTAQEIAIRVELDRLALAGITQYEYPYGVILDEVASNLIADGYDVERYQFNDPRESFSMVYFDDLAGEGHLYDYFECDCDCDCNEDDCSGCESLYDYFSDDDNNCGCGCNCGHTPEDNSSCDCSHKTCGNSCCDCNDGDNCGCDCNCEHKSEDNSGCNCSHKTCDNSCCDCDDDDFGCC